MKYPVGILGYLASIRKRLTHALYNCCCSDHPLAPWRSLLLYNGGVHSYSFGHRHCRYFAQGREWAKCRMMLWKLLSESAVKLHGPVRSFTACSLRRRLFQLGENPDFKICPIDRGLSGAGLIPEALGSLSRKPFSHTPTVLGRIESS